MSVELTVFQTNVISHLMDVHEISLTDITTHKKRYSTKTYKDKSVCCFHYNLKRRSALFTVEFQSRLFSLPESEIEKRIEYYWRKMQL